MSSPRKTRAGTTGSGPETHSGVDATDPGISHRLTFLLYRAVANLVNATAPFYRSFGLSIPAARAMVSLAESGGAMPVGRLSEVTGIDLSTISHLLRRIEKLGYVSRARDGGDNRIVVVCLTHAGAEVARTCREASLRHEAVMLHGITEGDAALLKEMLRKVNENCGSTHEELQCRPGPAT